MTFIAGSLFFFRGVFECFTEISDENNLDIYNVAPILAFALPDVVPIICILQVLLPFGLPSYVRACVRPVEKVFGSPGSPPALVVAASPVAPTSSTSPVSPASGTVRPLEFTRAAEQAQEGHIEPPTAHSRFFGVQRAPPGPTIHLKEGAGGVIAVY